MKIKTKFCKKCQTQKPIKEFGFRWRKQSKTLKSFCRTCAVKVATAWNKKNKDRYNKYQNNYYHNKVKNG